MNELMVKDRLDEIMKIESEFKFSLDDWWEDVGFSTKGNAKKSLIKELEEGFDYNVILEDKVQIEGGREVRRQVEDILMTEDAYKQWCLSAHTQAGKQLRKMVVRYIKELENQNREMKGHLIDNDLGTLIRQIDMQGTAIRKMYEEFDSFKKSYVKRVLKPSLELSVPIDKNAEITGMIRAYATRNNLDVAQVRTILYNHYSGRTHTYPKHQATKKGLTTIQWIREYGDINVLYECAKDYL